MIWSALTVVGFLLLIVVGTIFGLSFPPGAGLLILLVLIGVAAFTS